MNKHCNRCGELRDTLCFYRNHRHRDGLSTYCKECDNARHKTYEQRKKEVHYRWPLVGEAQYKPLRAGARDGEANICLWCPGLIECRTRTIWGMTVLCERADSRDAAREPKLVTDNAENL